MVQCDTVDCLVLQPNCSLSNERFKHKQIRHAFHTVSTEIRRRRAPISATLFVIPISVRMLQKAVGVEGFNIETYPLFPACSLFPEVSA